jgi:hypothetical protein
MSDDTEKRPLPMPRRREANPADPPNDLTHPIVDRDPTHRAELGPADEIVKVNEPGKWTIVTDPPKKRVLVARVDFSCAYQGGVLSFKAGAFITDPSHIAFCLGNGCPVRQLHDNVEYQSCPHCKNTFSTQV